MPFKAGDHICGLYSTRAELVDAVAPFLAEGLQNGERCWYVASPQQADAVRTAMKARHVDVTGATARGGLQLTSGARAYVVHGEFNPETTIRISTTRSSRRTPTGSAGSARPRI